MHLPENLRDAFVAMSSAIDVSSNTGFTLQFGPTLAACRCIKAVLPSQRCADTCSGENGQQSALCMQDSIYSINVSLKLMKKVNGSYSWTICVCRCQESELPGCCHGSRGPSTVGFFTEHGREARHSRPRGGQSCCAKRHYRGAFSPTKVTAWCPSPFLSLQMKSQDHSFARSSSWPPGSMR